MTTDINILQLNIRGMLTDDAQYRKCSQLSRLLETKQIDVVLLQDWCANKRQQVTNNSVKFPKKFLPNYNMHFHSTEYAILYQTGPYVTPLPLPKGYLKQAHRQNFHTCGIMLHSQTTDYSIYSVYRPQSANPNQISTYPFDSEHILIGGDFNTHHPLWGINQDCSKRINFLNIPTASNFQLINEPSPTIIDPRNETLPCIDITHRHIILKTFLGE